MENIETLVQLDKKMREEGYTLVSTCYSEERKIDVMKSLVDFAISKKGYAELRIADSSKYCNEIPQKEFYRIYQKIYSSKNDILT